jgi:hypothetical protein
VTLYAQNSRTMARTAVRVGVYAPLTNVHQDSVVPSMTLRAAALASPQTTTQAIVATADGPVHHQTTTVASINARNAISALDLLFALLQPTTALETLSAPTPHPIRKTADTVATSVLLISAPQVAAVLNIRWPAETIAFSLITIRVIAGIVILSVRTVRFVRMEEAVSVATIRGLDQGGDHARLSMRVSSWTIGVRTWGRTEMAVDVGHVAIPARMRPRRAMMALVPNAPSATMLSRMIACLLVGVVSRILFKVKLSENCVLRSVVH